VSETLLQPRMRWIVLIVSIPSLVQDGSLDPAANHGASYGDPSLTSYLNSLEFTSYDQEEDLPPIPFLIGNPFVQRPAPPFGITGVPSGECPVIPEKELIPFFLYAREVSIDLTQT
jgi:hypothetical protein